jgi:hypothetical protein
MKKLSNLTKGSAEGSGNQGKSCLGYMNFRRLKASTSWRERENHFPRAGWVRCQDFGGILGLIVFGRPRGDGRKWCHDVRAAWSAFAVV